MSERISKIVSGRLSSATAGARHGHQAVRARSPDDDEWRPPMAVWLWQRSDILCVIVGIAAARCELDLSQIGGDGERRRPAPDEREPRGAEDPI